MYLTLRFAKSFFIPCMGNYIPSSDPVSPKALLMFLFGARISYAAKTVFQKTMNKKNRIVFRNPVFLYFERVGVSF
jgi:hypothetical protein